MYGTLFNAVFLEEMSRCRIYLEASKFVRIYRGLYLQSPISSR